jgi:hypothetical protein
VQRTPKEQKDYFKKIRLQPGESTARITDDIFSASSEGTSYFPEQGEERLTPAQTSTQTHASKENPWAVERIIAVVVGIVTVLGILGAAGAYVVGTKTEVQAVSKSLDEHKQETKQGLSKLDSSITHLKDTQIQDIRDVEGRLRQTISEVNTRVDRFIQQPPPVPQQAGTSKQP